MESKSKSGERGSARLFSIEPHDHEALASALGLARQDYELKWWWKYGQPAIDRIIGVLEVKGPKLGSTISGFMQMNGPDLQVTAQCFPHGIPKPEWFRVEVNIDRSM